MIDPLKRLTLPEILAHDWLKETNDDSEDSDADEENKSKEDGKSKANKDENEDQK